MGAKRLTPNKIANLVMADDAWHDSEYVAAADYDALLAELAAERARADDMADKAAKAVWHAAGVEADRDRLRAALEEIASKVIYTSTAAVACVRIARAALEAK